VVVERDEGTPEDGAPGDEGEAPQGDQPITRVQRFRTTGDIEQAARVRARELQLRHEADHSSPAAVESNDAVETGTPAEDPDPVSSEADALRALTAAPMPGLEGVVELPPTGRQRYESVGELGSGGMSTVVRVVDHALGREVAMKTLRADRRDSREHARALQREARLIGALEHPAIIPVFDLGLLDDRTPFYTMRVLPASSLAAVLQGLRAGEPAIRAQYDLRRLVRILVQIAQGLAHAHSRGVVHRDLKPGNVLLGDFGEVRIMDWGIAKRMGSERPPGIEGLVFGTPAYMSPEQAQGQDSKVDHRSDIYSLGVILYEILTLRRPPQAATTRQQIIAAARPEQVPPSAVARGREVPDELDELTMQMMARDPEQRPATMREIWQALERFLAGVQDRARRTAEAERCYRRAVDELNRYQAMLEERQRLQDEEERLQRVIRPWDDQSAKQQRWRLTHRLQRLEVLIAHAFGIATELLRQAVDTVEHPDARQTLIELYWHRHDAAEAVDDSATKLFFARLAHDLEDSGEAEDAIGLLHIRSSPPGAVVWAVPFHEYDDPGTGAPGAQFEIGVTPITGCRLPVGPYVIIARLDGHREAQEACYMRQRGADMLLLLDPWSRDLPTTGREVALASLWSLAFDMEIRSRVTSCLVTGLPGMGKNRLLDAFRAEVKEHPTRMYVLLEVSCAPLRRDLPYSVLVELLRLRAAVMASDTADEMRRKVRRMVLQAFTRFGRQEPSEAARAQSIAVADTISTLPAFDLIDPDRGALQSAIPAVDHDKLVDALATYFRELAACSPVQILIRNVQYMDDASRDLLGELLVRVDSSPILLLATAGVATSDNLPQPVSITRAAPSGGVLRYDAEIVLAPLPRPAFDQLVREMLAAPVEPRLQRWIGEHANGVPFVAAELISVLRRTGAIQYGEHGWAFDVHEPPTIRAGDVPAAVRALIDTLPEHVRDALAAAVVVGQVFWRGALRTLGVARLDEALEILVERGLLIRNATSRYVGEVEYALTSSLRWRVAYDMSRPRRRRKLHRNTATWMATQGRTDLEEALAMAHHLSMGGQPEEAAILLQRVAQAAMASKATAEARRLYTRVHVLTDDAQLQDRAERALRSLAVPPVAGTPGPGGKA